MPTQRNRLLEAALAYARLGVPVTPAHPVVRVAQGRGWRRRWVCGCGWGCGCGHGQCATPGAHPRGAARRLIDLDAVTKAWVVEEPPAVLISPCEVIDIWRLPRELGALGMRLFESQRPSAWPPLMQVADGSWVVCTRSANGPLPVIEAYGETVRRCAPDDLVLVPPSRRLNGRLHWLWAQRFPNTPLPEPWQVLSALSSAAELLQPWERRDEMAAEQAKGLSAS